MLCKTDALMFSLCGLLKPYWTQVLPNPPFLCFRLFIKFKIQLLPLLGEGFIFGSPHTGMVAWKVGEAYK